MPMGWRRSGQAIIFMINSEIGWSLQASRYRFFGNNNQVSRLILLPNLAYRSTFNDSISFRVKRSFSSVADTESSILLLEFESNSCTSANGSMKKVSPILYLKDASIRQIRSCKLCVFTYDTFSSSSANSSSFDISSRSSLSFWVLQSAMLDVTVVSSNVLLSPSVPLLVKFHVDAGD